MLINYHFFYILSFK